MGSWVTNIFSGVWFYQEGDEEPICKICGRQLSSTLEWGIVNGIAYCSCTASYRCLNRDEKGKVLDKEPICIVVEELIPKYREAWESSKDIEKYKEKVSKINSEYDKMEVKGNE